MTKISNLYSLTNYISANSSGNVTIAAPTSGFTLDVTGNFRATAGYFPGGIVSISSLSSTLIINRTATTSGGAAVGFATDSIYQWVLGLKSDVNENLYLYNPTGIDYVIFNAVTGGATFNYPLSGTSATFSGNVSILANSARLTVSESGGAEIRVTAGGSTGFIGTYSNHSLTFLTNSATALTIASTGAATFSSSVTAVTNMTITGASSSIAPQLVLAQTGGNTYSAIGINRADGTGVAAGLGSALILRSGDAANAPIQFATANNVRMTIGTTGNVGIGTTAPGVKLEVVGTKQTIVSTDNGVVNITDTSGFAANSGGSLVFRGVYNSTGSTAGTGFIDTLKDNGTDGNYSYAMAFGSRSNGSSSVERMRITSGGNVAIGMTSASQRLQVNGRVRVSPDDNNGGDIAVDDGGLAFSTIGATPITFQRNNYSAVSMRITGTGLVGIGSTLPSRNFQVSSGGDTYIRVAGNRGNADGVHIGNLEFFNGFSAVMAGEIRGITGTGGTQSASGQLAFYTNNAGSYAERMRITSTGNIRFFITPAVDTNLEWFNTGNSTVQARIWADGNPRLNVQVNGTGGVYVAPGGTSWTAASDERLKTNLTPIENGIDKVNQLRSVTGRYLTDDESKSRSFLIAQDILSVLPEAVDIDTETGMMGVQYTEVIPLLVASIKELSAKVTALENK